MFPNINNNLGLTPVKKALDATASELPTTNSILEAVKICFKSNQSFSIILNDWIENNFSVNVKDDGPIAVPWTAMGPKNACSYADLTMGEIDLQVKFSSPIKLSLWWQYRDDVFYL